MLQNVAVMSRVAELRRKAEAQTLSRKQRIEEELERMAFANVQDFTRVDEQGNLVPDFSNATREQLAAIASVTTKRRVLMGRKGEVLGEEVQNSFKQADKYRGLEALMRIEGMGQQNANLTVVVDVADRLLRARQRVPMLPRPDEGVSDTGDSVDDT